MKIILLGTAWPYRGGLASFNERLIKQFKNEGHNAEIITFTLQYPGFLFPGKTQYAASPPTADIKITRKLNSVNLLSWIQVGNNINKHAPDILIIKYWIPFMAPCFGTIAKIAKKNKKTKVICIADNIIPHEKKLYDTPLTKYFLNQMDGVIAMSASVMEDLKKFVPGKPALISPHPLFDNFGNKISKEIACKNLNLDPSKKYILFFGFIRAYKGLDILLNAIADERLKNKELTLIIAGEYYSAEKKYTALIEKLQLDKNVIQFNKFIPDEEVANYFCVADIVVQPYKNATQSGVTQIAYHFEIPMLVTNVGALPEMVADKKAGYVVEPDATQIADALLDFYDNNRKDFFADSIKEEKKRFSWDKMTASIIALSLKVGLKNAF